MNKFIKFLTCTVMTATICCIASTGVQAAPYNNKTFDFKQPDGSDVQVKITGDEYFQQVESLDGYTLCVDKNGWICYAKLNADESAYVSTGEVYKGSNSFSDMKLQNINENNINHPKHIKLKKEAIIKKANTVKKILHGDNFGDKSSLKTTNNSNDLLDSKVTSKTGITAASQATNVKGLTILIDFPDTASSISKEDINDFFNMQGYTGYNNNGSVRDYFYDVSGGKLTYTNSIVGFYTAKHPKSYYNDMSAEVGDYSKAVELANEAVAWAKSSGFNFSSLTVDSGNNVKGVNLLYAGNADSDWGKGIWPHQGYLDNRVTANGVGIQRYEMSNIGSDLSIDTICHENGHLICEYPDLYDYDGDSQGTGAFGIMSGTANAKNPAPPDPYCRNIISGWNTTTNLNTYNSSTVTALSNQNGNQAVYKWSGSNPKEYFLVENIQKTGRYADVPTNGLAIWHVDETGDNSKNQMTTNSHFQVSLEQADGKFDLEKNRNGGDAGDLFRGGSKNTFSDTTTPNSRWWNGTSSGLDISQISNSGANMTFVKGGTITPTTNLAGQATASTSYCSTWETTSALNDGVDPTSSADRSSTVYGNWPETGTQWVEYDFNQKYKISSCDVYWFKDGGGIDVPASYKITYWNGSAWVPVANPKGLGVAVDKYNTTKFTSVTTNKIRIEMTSKGTSSTGILEWKLQ